MSGGVAPFVRSEATETEVHDPSLRVATVPSISLVPLNVKVSSATHPEPISLLLVLPLALPGIITGLALYSAFNFAGVTLSIITIIIGHTTFCIVVVYNNVLARLRRTAGSLNEASADLGAYGLQTFRYVTLPTLSTAVVAGALLAFALSFDEVIVTYFTAGAQNTLPLWIFGAIQRGQQLPEVNAVVVFVIALTIIPVAIAVRLTGGGGVTRSSVAAAQEQHG